MTGEIVELMNNDASKMQDKIRDSGAKSYINVEKQKL